jgi:hypothetical protein
VDDFRILIEKISGNGQRASAWPSTDMAQEVSNLPNQFILLVLVRPTSVRRFAPCNCPGQWCENLCTFEVATVGRADLEHRGFYATRGFSPRPRINRHVIV